MEWRIIYWHVSNCVENFEFSIILKCLSASHFARFVYINDYFLFASYDIVASARSLLYIHVHGCGHICVCVSAIFPPRYFSRWNLQQTEKKNSLMEAYIFGSVLDTFKGPQSKHMHFLCMRARMCVCALVWMCALAYLSVDSVGRFVYISIFYYFRNVVIIQSSFRLNWNCFRFFFFFHFASVVLWISVEILKN